MYICIKLYFCNRRKLFARDLLYLQLQGCSLCLSTRLLAELKEKEAHIVIMPVVQSKCVSGPDMEYDSQFGAEGTSLEFVSFSSFLTTQVDVSACRTSIHKECI